MWDIIEWRSVDNKGNRNRLEADGVGVRYEERRQAGRT